MSICFDHIYFRPKISAACFKISFSILNCWFSFRSRISSSCSGVRLSFSWKEPELDACLTHLSNREVAMSYSRQISHLRLPERYSSTSCCLNSSVYLRGFLRCFGSVIMSAPLYIYYRLYDLKKSVQLIVAYPLMRNIPVTSFFKRPIRMKPLIGTQIMVRLISTWLRIITKRLSVIRTSMQQMRWLINELLKKV